jgi:KUP system potassium uptake protein
MDAPLRTAAPAARSRAAPVALAALGVVFGDIGTSPLYTLHECVQFEPGHVVNTVDVMGALSLVFWALTMVVTVKYLTFILRADANGEGGIFALLALLPFSKDDKSRRPGVIPWAAVLVVFGAALLYGDGMITPSISVLSAMEGLDDPAPWLKPAVVPLTVLVLLGLFAIQRRGTGKVGALFGPIMAVWFVTIAALGAIQIAQHPSILAAISPTYAAAFFSAHGLRGALILGAVVLAVTGGEALYADLGHFGTRPIRMAWLALVMPALVINYFGQGAKLLADPSAVDSPFFALVPRGPLTYPLVVLAAAATVIASQALISGAFSLTSQAVQLGFFPRVTVRHTSTESEGQIYVPEINWGLAIACVVLVLTFQASTRLAAAYGIAVTGTMAITSLIYFEVTRKTWKWPLWKSLPLLLLFLSFDIPFFVANLFKFVDGGYVPIAVAAVLSVIMITWKRGRMIYAAHVDEISQPVETFCGGLAGKLETRIDGATVFLTGRSHGIPPALAQYVSRIRVLPKTVVLLRLNICHKPYVPADAMRVENLGAGLMRLTIDRGFMDVPNVPRLLGQATARFSLPLDLANVTYCIGRETFLATSQGKMGALSENLFSFLSRNSSSATTHFCIPPEQVVEIGSQIDL